MRTILLLALLGFAAWGEEKIILDGKLVSASALTNLVTEVVVLDGKIVAKDTLTEECRRDARTTIAETEKDAGGTPAPQKPACVM